jgi:hypothetical protein
VSRGVIESGTISSPQSYRKAYLGNAYGNHDETRCPWPKAGITSEKKSAHEQQYYGDCIGEPHCQSRVFENNKREDNRKSRQNNKNTNARRPQKVSPRQLWTHVGRRHLIYFFAYQFKLRWSEN